MSQTYFRFDALSAAKAQAQKFAEEYPKQVLAQQPAQLVIEEAPRSQYRPRPRQPQQAREQAREQQQHRRERRDVSTERRRVGRQSADIESYIQQQEAQQLQLVSELQAFIQQQDSQLQQQPHKRRQAQEYRSEEEYYQQQQQQQQAQEPEPQQQYLAHRAYRRLAQPPPEQVPQYSHNVPQQIQEILRFQARIPYDVIANQIVYRPEKPYIPQPVQPPAPAQYKAAETPDYAAEQQQTFVKPLPPQQQQQQQYQQHQQQRDLGYYADQRSTPRPVTEQQY